MKIIQLTTFFHPVVGGVESHVLELSKQLIKAGHEVEVMTSDSAKNKGRIKDKTDEISGIKITRGRVFFSFSYFYKIYPSLFFKLLKKDFDILHVHGFRKYEMYIALFVAKLKKKKIIVTTHNPFVVKFNSRSRLLNFFVGIHDLTFGKIFPRFLDHVIVLSKNEIPVLKKFGIKEEKITVIPNGISNLFFVEGNKQKFLKDFDIDVKWDNVVVGAGRVHKVKGFQNLKHAVHKLKKVLFIISGADDGYLPELKEMYKENENIIFLERNLSQEQLNNLFNLADLFLFPSLHEAFGIILVEAMASGLPVISTNIGGPKEIVKDNFGILIDPTDQGLWTSKIQWLLSDKELRKKMGENARKAAKKYRWDSIIRTIEKAYLKALQYKV